MDVVAEGSTGNGLFTRLAAPFAFVVYCLVVIAAASRHEPWADEAQSWLLARDASLFSLWTKLLHYEGTPGLWQTLLHCLIRAGVPFAALPAVSVVLGIGAAALWMFRSPFALWLRIAVPFTFFLAYQYTVIARSYSLLPLIVFLCAVSYSSASLYPWRFAVALDALALVSVHGAALSVAIWIGLLASERAWKRFTLPGIVYLVLAGIGAAAAWPADDAVFVTRWNFSPEHFAEVTLRTLGESFTGNAWVSGLVLLFSTPFLWKGRALLTFGVAAAFLCSVGALIYSQVWHQGAVLLAWLFAMWVAASRTEVTRLAVVSMAIVIVFGSYWSVCSVVYDWNHAYSGGAQAAAFLRREWIPEQGVYAIGYACTAIQPYFPANVFGNVNGDGKAAYWDWSTANHTNEDVGRLAKKRPRFVIVGYKNEFEHGLWTAAVLQSGYRLRKHFEGNVFWRDRVFEPESYDLFQLDSTAR